VITAKGALLLLLLLLLLLADFPDKICVI